MSAIDEFTELKKIKDELLAYEWSAGDRIPGGLRLFEDTGGRTSEHSLSQREKQVLGTAMGFTERQNGVITYNPNKVVANSIRQVLIHYCDQQLRKLAEQAKKEARNILKVLE